MCTIYLSFEGRTLEEVRQKIRECGIMDEEDQPTVSLIMPTVEPEVTQPDVNLKEQAPEATQPDVKPEDPVVKLEDVRAAANAYRDKHGIDALREIFKKYGGEKLKDIPSENYRALMLEIL